VVEVQRKIPEACGLRRHRALGSLACASERHIIGGRSYGWCGLSETLAPRGDFMWARLWSLCRRLWNRVSQQVQTPLKVRLFYASAIAALFVLWLDVPVQNRFAVLGIVYSVLGAGTLFGESIMSNDTCLRMARDLMKYPPPRNIRRIGWIWWPIAITIFWIVYAAYFGYTYERDLTYEDYRDIVYVVATFLFVISVVYFLIFFVLDRILRWIARSLAAAQNRGLIPRVKAGLRATGFALLAVGGVLQLPILICPPT
jgi:hypothetical protein